MAKSIAGVMRAAPKPVMPTVKAVAAPKVSGHPHANLGAYLHKAKGK